jgi:hypothetical protein
MGVILPHLGAMWDHSGPACTIGKPYGADGWDPGASVEVTRWGTLGSIAALWGPHLAKLWQRNVCVALAAGSYFYDRPVQCAIVMLTAARCE